MSDLPSASDAQGESTGYIGPIREIEPQEVCSIVGLLSLREQDTT